MRQLSLQNPIYRKLEADFREWLALLGYAESTVYNLPNHVHEFLHYLEQFEMIEIASIHTHHVHRFFLQLKKRKNIRRSGKLSAGHLNKYLQALRLLSKYIRQTNQGHFTVSLPNVKGIKPIPSVLTTDEVQNLFAACEPTHYGLRDKAMLSVLYGCGLRRSEVVSLEVEDLLITSELLYVRAGKNYTERYVPMNESIIHHLQNYLKHGRPMLVKRSNPALLLNYRGGRLGGESLLHRLQHLKTKAGIRKPIGLHTLRHSIATHLLTSGMSLENIARFLGHQSLESTQIYTHLADELY